MKKSTITTMTLMAVTASMLSGCSGGGSTGVVQQTAAGQGEKQAEAVQEVDKSLYEIKEPITIKWWHSLDTQYTDVVNKVVEDYNASQDLVTVEAEYIGNYSQINEALVAAHAAGTDLPAITVSNTPYVAEYGAGGLTEDLTPYIAASEYDVEDFGDGMLLASQYEGKQVALPFLISTQVMYYNKDMAEEKGITIPEKFADMDAFLEAATEFNSDGTTKVYGTVIPGWDQWYFETFYLNHGVKIINEDGESTDLDSAQAMEIADKFKEWCDKGYAYWASGADASSVMRQNYIDGKAFSVLHTSSLYNTYVDSCDFEVGMAWLPGDNTSNQEIGGSVLLIPSKNDQATKNAAWDFLQYLCSKDVNMTWAKGTGYMPTRKSVLHTDEGQKFLEEKPAFQCIFDNLDLIQPRIQHKAWNQLVTVWMNSMSEAMLEPDAEMDTIIEQMVEEINDVLSDS